METGRLREGGARFSFDAGVPGERQQGLNQQVCTPQLLASMQVGPPQVS
jgi:hypothetical protein